jgi:hypothetical protein
MTVNKNEQNERHGIIKKVYANNSTFKISKWL